MNIFAQWTCVVILLLVTVYSHASGKVLFDADVGYSATSYLNAINPGGHKFKSILNVNHAPGMTRYTKPVGKYEAIRILRHDKDLVWIIHPEDRRFYPGLKLYQEFKLGKGMGLGPHLDHIMRTRQVLKSLQELKNLGKEKVNGFLTTHYQKKERNRGYEKVSYNVTDYWVSDHGILIKMKLVAPKVSVTMETKKIKLAKQSGDLFVPPPGYEKRGVRISWSEEKRKLAAKNKKVTK